MYPTEGTHDDTLKHLEGKTGQPHEKNETGPLQLPIANQK